VKIEISGGERRREGGRRGRTEDAADLVRSCSTLVLRFPCFEKRLELVWVDPMLHDLTLALEMKNLK